MATEKLTLEVATPRGLALRTETDSVQAPGVQGEFGVLPGHLPVLSALQSGVLSYREGQATKRVAIGPGFAQAEAEKVLILTELFARADEVDAETAREERNKAEQALASFDEPHEGPDHRELKRDLDWAQARLDILES